MSAVRLVSSAKNLREQFKSPTSSSITMGSNNTHNGSISRSQTLGPPANGSSLSRRGTLLRTSSSGNLNRTKSIPKKSIISKVFADEESKEQETLPDLSMDMTYLIVKRCVKEIRERGLATKGILRQVQMAPNQKVIMNTIRTILDDDASTELSPLRQIDIHLVAHSMKWAIRYSEEILVTHDDYRALYINQDRDFVRFAHSLPPTNRATLLELFSLCADVTLLAHLNNMTLVSVAKAISLSIMAGPEREFTTFDASLQQRNIWGAACEDLLRAFLRIKTSYDLAKIDQEDEVDENRYICTETRQLKNAREQSSMMRLDISTPSSTSSTGWPTPSGIVTSASCSNATGYFDMVPQPSGSSPAHAGGSFGASLSRTPSLAKSNRPISMAINMNDFEELMHDQSRREPQPDRNSLLRPADQTLRRRSSVTDMDSLYMLPAEATTGLDGYESDPEVNHAIEDEEDSQDALIPDFADGLGWDFSKAIDLTSSDMLSLDTFKPESDKDKAGVNRSNSASSNTSGIGPSGPPQTASPRTIRDLSKQQLVEMRLQTQVQQAPSMDEIKSPTSPLQRMGSINRPRMGHVRQNSSTSRTRRHSSRRSISINSGRLHMKPGGLQADLLAHELALKTEKDMVARDIRQRLRGIKESDSQEPAAAVNPGFSLQLSPPDLERPSALGPRRSHLSLKDRPKTMLELNFDLPVLTAEPLSTMINEPVSTAVAKEPEDNDDTRAFEVVSRPRYTESAPLVSSPKEEQKFKLPESTPERAATPPEARRTPPFGRPKRSATDSSSRSGTKTPPTPDKNRAPLQQTVAHSTGSITSSPGESKSKTPGFIRALSSKLRSKQNEDQPKPVRINNQVVGTPAVPSVPLELPRLELSFMGDSLRPSQLVPSPDSLEVHQLPALAVPSSNENLRRASLPNTDNSKGRQDLQPTGFAAVRRASAAVFGSGNHSVREQNQKTKQGADAATTSAAASEVLKTRNGDDSGPKASKAVLPKEQASVPQELPREYSFPKKEAASEREIQFSTALLLKDDSVRDSSSSTWSVSDESSEAAYRIGCDSNLAEEAKHQQQPEHGIDDCSRLLQPILGSSGTATTTRSSDKGQVDDQQHDNKYEAESRTEPSSESSSGQESPRELQDLDQQPDHIDGAHGDVCQQDGSSSDHQQWELCEGIRTSSDEPTITVPSDDVDNSDNDDKNDDDQPEDDLKTEVDEGTAPQSGCEPEQQLEVQSVGDIFGWRRTRQCSEDYVRHIFTNLTGRGNSFQESPIHEAAWISCCWWWWSWLLCILIAGSAASA